MSLIRRIEALEDGPAMWVLFPAGTGPAVAINERRQREHPEPGESAAGFRARLLTSGKVLDWPIPVPRHQR